LDRLDLLPLKKIEEEKEERRKKKKERMDELLSSLQFLFICGVMIFIIHQVKTRKRELKWYKTMTKIKTNIK
jgi:ABC-type phosphate/phosphonate transport system permease subunit